MATLAPQERLQPALLDRLVDDAPDHKVEPREARLITARRLRAAVLRDLAWLFNATRSNAIGLEAGQAPHAAKSVLNYGLPALSGNTASMLDVVDLETQIRRAIVDFEPRIVPSTLKVRALESAAALDHHNQIQVEIRGQLWAQPVPIEILLRTEVDLESGKVQIQDLNG
jgi:type VI secretion system protein ImpF